MAVRRTLLRWAWRSFRREWRQQALVLALLVVAVAAAVGFEAVVYNTSGVREQAQFGAAHHRYEIAQADPGALAAGVDAARERIGAVDVIGRWDAPLPGSVDTVDYLSQDPDGTFAAPMLALVEGRYPGSAAELALTDGLAATLDAGTGDEVDLDGRSRTVVGIVENPSDLERDFALAAPGQLDRADAVWLLLGGSGAFDEVREIRALGREHLPAGELTSRSGGGRDRAAAVVLGAAQVVLVLVGLVASAGFAAIAQRRLRQLGLLGAMGATERHLALVVLANGALVGLLAAGVGGLLGLGAWLVAAPRIEEPVGYRIDDANLPWLLVVATLACTVATATAAAWIPARTASRLSIVRALSGRPGAPVPAGRSARAGVALIALGLVLLAGAGPLGPLALAAGTLLTVAGTLVASPMVAQTLGAIARPFPVAVRLALRDLARNRTRSSIALAAIGLALGIPAGVVIASASAEADEDLPNLPDHQALVWTKDASQPDGVSPFYTEDASDEGFAPYLPDLDDADRQRLDGVVADAAASAGADLVPLEVAVDPAVADDPEGRRAVTIARRTDIGYLDVALVYVATPALLEPYDAEAATDLLTTGPPGPPEIVTDAEQLWLANTADPPAEVGDHTELDGSYRSLPGSFLTPEALAARRWTSTTVGWLLSAPDALTPDQLGDLREVAVREGLVIEGPEAPDDLTTLRWMATAIGVLVALAVLGMTVGLLRVEAGRDVRVLVATGASASIRRTITAATAGALAAAGGLLGTVGAYLVLGVGYLRDVGSLVPVPIPELVVIVVGLPLVAAIAGFLVSAGEPTALARPVVE